MAESGAFSCLYLDRTVEGRKEREEEREAEWFAVVNFLVRGCLEVLGVLDVLVALNAGPKTLLGLAAEKALHDGPAVLVAVSRGEGERVLRASEY